MDIFELVKSGDVFTIVVCIIILIITGGTAQAIIAAIAANRRGIKGDALVKEQNGIEGLTKLSGQQDVFIEKLQNQVTTLEDKVDEITGKLEAMEAKWQAEVDYNRTLMHELNTHNIPIPPRDTD